MIRRSAALVEESIDDELGVPPVLPRGAVAEILHRPLAAAALALLFVFVAVAVFAPLIAPYGDNEQNLRAILESPSSSHWLGTDDLGRDVLSRTIFGTRISLRAGLQAVVVAVLLGVTGGLIAGYRGGAADTTLSRLNDAAMSVPGLVLALTVVAVLGPGLTNAMLAIGLIQAPSFFRITRAATMNIRHNTFIEASVVIGCSSRRVIWAHVLPNALPPILVQMSLALGAAIVAEASLSFLGLGVRPPAPSWGTMLSLAAKRPGFDYLLWGPAVALVLLVLVFVVLGDALRDIVAGSED